MPVEIIPQRPYAQCYICHAPNVAKVCHHCGRAICEKESCKSATLPGALIVPNMEFAFLGLEKEQTPPTVIHCKPCVQKYHGRNVLGRLFNNLLRKNYPPLPVKPGMEITITETLNDKISLGADGAYHAAKVQPDGESANANLREGKLEVSCQLLEQDRERLRAYRRRFHTGARDIPFHAGFVVLEGTNKLQPLNREPKENLVIQVVEPPVIDTFRLSGKLNEQGFLNGPNSYANNWKGSFPYTFAKPDGKLIPAPVQIVATLAADPAQHTLELVVQLQFDDEFEKVKLDEFTLFAPEEAGRIVNTQPAVRVNPELDTKDEKPAYTVTWRSLPFETAKDKSRWRDFSVTFQEKINPTLQLRGKLQLTCTGTISGLKDAKVFYPWGEKRDDVKVKRQTKVSIEFDLDLGQLRVQTLHRVRPATTPLEDRGIQLDHRFVAELTRKLSQAGVTLQARRENPGRTSKLDSHTTNRMLEFSGRHTIDRQPVDFHLLFIGTEHGERPGQSYVKADIHVQGLGATPEMSDKIAEFHELLREQIEQTFKAVKEDPNRAPVRDRPGFP